MISWQERWEQVGDVRGLGAMLAIELVLDRDTKQPAPELVERRLRGRLRRRACCCSRPGIYSNCIRVLVPLVIGDAELDEALGVWEQALETVLGA